ncbi:MAG: S8 family serine peptidase, partial [Actinomycetota bacterium]|nr:S8 family serine peptidase [Actinomycetota bacterium]
MASASLVAGPLSAARAAVPYPTPSNGTSSYDYQSYLYVTNGDCSSGSHPDDSNLPANFDCKDGDSAENTNYAPRPGDPNYDPSVDSDPAELCDPPDVPGHCGIEGNSVNLAWQTTTGRPDTVVGELDSGIRWDGRYSISGQKDPDEIDEIRSFRKKIALNRGELPQPGPAGCQSPGFAGYDRNCDGVFNVVDYEATAGCQVNCVEDKNGNDLVDPEDLILTYSDKTDADSNGYVDDIAGWDFFEGDNDPNDDVDYGHGTGEVEDSNNEARYPGEAGHGDPGTCPSCMVVPLRVGDSFVADVNRFAQATVYATDLGASVVQEALGTLNNSSFGQAAVNYAYAHGVIVVASAADEEAEHHNYPSNYEHTMTVNSVRSFESACRGCPPQNPRSYLYLNGCTNFGGHIYVAVEAGSCSSGATGNAGGIAGLVYSAARNAVDRHQMTNYVNDDGSTAGYPLSANEAMQIVRESADDIDFSPGNSTKGYTTQHATPTRRFQTTSGWDVFTGYGRIDANGMMTVPGFSSKNGSSVAIPPEADISSPPWFSPLPTTGSVPIVGRAAANRSTPVAPGSSAGYCYRVQFAPGVQPPITGGDTWTTIASGKQLAGNGRPAPATTALGTLNMSEVADAVAAHPPAFDPANDPTSRSMPDKNAFRLRLVVDDLAHVSAVDVAANNCPLPEDANAELSKYQGVFQKQLHVGTAGTWPPSDDPDLFGGFPKQLGSDGAGAPAFVDLNGDGKDEVVLSSSDGKIYAFQSDGSQAPGFPVHTDPLPLPSTGSNAYTRGQVPSTVYSPVLLGSPAIGHLLGDQSTLQIAVAAFDGNVYVWNEDGSPVPGFPVSTNPQYWHEPGCETTGGPPCDDFQGPMPASGQADPGTYLGVGKDIRDSNNMVDRGFTAAPVMADIDPSKPGLDLIAGAEDNHIYAWHADGSPVAGYPLLLHDPRKVCAVDLTTNKMSYKASADPAKADPHDGQDPSIPIPDKNPGSKIVAGLSVGDADGHPGKEIVATINEEYYEAPNSSGLRDQVGQIISQVADSGNGRVYLLDRRGSGAPGSPPDASSGPCYPASVQPTTFPGAQAALPGWPHKIASIDVGVLPDVGEGPDGAPTLGPVNGDGTLDVGIAMQAGPGYILKPDSTSQFGTGPDGKDITLANSPDEYKGTAQDGPSFVAVGGGVFGHLLPDSNALGWAAPTGGLNRLLDIVEDEQQLGAQDEVAAWDAKAGSFFKGFPAEVNDLQFFETPAIADVDGDGVAEVLEGSAVNDLTATNALDAPVPGWPKFTAGWMVVTPGTGDFDGDKTLDVAAVTRDGWLFVWKTSGDACQDQEWPK